MMKNPDAAGKDSNPNVDFLLDTTPRATYTIKSWMHMFDILEHEIINCPKESIKE
jgi:hypothetical protein